MSVIPAGEGSPYDGGAAQARRAAPEAEGRAAWTCRSRRRRREPVRPSAPRMRRRRRAGRRQGAVCQQPRSDRRSMPCAPPRSPPMPPCPSADEPNRASCAPPASEPITDPRRVPTDRCSSSSLPLAGGLRRFRPPSRSFLLQEPTAQPPRELTVIAMQEGSSQPIAGVALTVGDATAVTGADGRRVVTAPRGAEVAAAADGLRSGIGHRAGGRRPDAHAPLERGERHDHRPGRRPGGRRARVRGRTDDLGAHRRAWDLCLPGVPERAP